MISGFRTTKVAVVAKYHATITVHCRGFWLSYKSYCGNQFPCNNYHALPWWLATVQSIPWLPITVHQLLCNTVVAAYRGKRYRDEKSLPRKALVVLGTRDVGATPSTAYSVLSRVLAAGTLDLGAIQILVNPSLHNVMLLDQTGPYVSPAMLACFAPFHL